MARSGVLNREPSILILPVTQLLSSKAGISTTLRTASYIVT